MAVDESGQAGLVRKIDFRLPADAWWPLTTDSIRLLL
jgi:hypothetical protein